MEIWILWLVLQQGDGLPRAVPVIGGDSEIACEKSAEKAKEFFGEHLVQHECVIKKQPETVYEY